MWRVMRDDGTCWLNLGDAYCNSQPRGHFGDQGDLSTGSHGEKVKMNLAGLPGPKNLMGQPWRAAFALQDDGWILRSAITWAKPNPMPESVTDRPTSAYEMIFLLAKQGKYFYDAEAVREPHDDKAGPPSRFGVRPRVSSEKPYGVRSAFTTMGAAKYNPAGRNTRNVWTIPTQGRPDAHFATFPDELPRRCILAGTSEYGACGECGAPWARMVGKQDIDRSGNHNPGGKAKEYPRGDTDNWNENDGRGFILPERQTLGWSPTCGCNAATVPAEELDPFAGSGTTCAVAQSLGRSFVGLDLDPEYLGIAAKRIGTVSLPFPSQGGLV